MFATASDTAVGRVVEFKAVIQNYSMFTFDVTSAYMLERTNLSFWNRHRRRLRNMVIACERSIRVIYGRRKGCKIVAL